MSAIMSPSPHPFFFFFTTCTYRIEILPRYYCNIYVSEKAREEQKQAAIQQLGRGLALGTQLEGCRNRCILCYMPVLIVTCCSTEEPLVR